jgi:type VI secretion system protein ImpH
MANQEGHPADSLSERLRGDQCTGYDFFRLVRLIQAAYPECPPIGRSKTPQDDPIRFGQRPSLAFAPGTLEELVPGKPPKLYVNFFGLFGPNGPLPLHITQYAIRRQLGQLEGGGPQRGQSLGSLAEANPGAIEGYKDQVLADFFDIFHHRLISLFFRAWATCQPTVDLDRGRHERFLFFVGATWGDSLGRVDDSAAPDSIPVHAKAFYAGRLCSPTRNAEGLEATIQDYFGIRTQIQEFVGRWFDLPGDNWTLLGRSRAAGVMGENLIVGSRTWAAHLSFRITMGPMPFADFTRLLPREPGFRRLQSWIVNYVGTQLTWDLQLVLKRDEVPDTVLGKAGLLGWTTWLKTGVLIRDADQLVLAGDATETVN